MAVTFLKKPSQSHGDEDKGSATSKLKETLAAKSKKTNADGEPWDEETDGPQDDDGSEQEKMEVEAELDEGDTGGDDAEPNEGPQDKPKKLGGIDLSGKQAEGKVSITHPDGTTEEKVEDVGDIVLTDEPLYNVGVSFGRTINLGDYNSANVKVTLHIPCVGDDVEEAYETAAGWCKQKIEELVPDGDEG